MEGARRVTSPTLDPNKATGTANPAADLVLTAQIEPFDSFWEGPGDVEKGGAATPVITQRTETAMQADSRRMLENGI